MTKLTMLGTGSGGTLDLYNTCFVIQNENGDFLVDTGGSIEVIKRLKEINIDIKDIKHIFISHNHTDHIFGLIWILRKLSWLYITGKFKTTINIYCNDIVYESIIGICKYVFPEKLVNGVLDIVDFHIVKDNEQAQINGINYTFFDIKARGTKQFGFECNINEKRLVFLGDETINPELYDRVRGADYVMHEAFCLDSEESIFGAYEKNHSTVKTASKIMNKLDVKNLILYHTEESHGNERKALYEKEGKESFNGKICVPNDLEEIEL